ncbi:NAD(P)-dependent oxidoreductase [Rhodospirillaceae bacterium KN72]|uniref:NAD(P)-dependent oxidoreductase n=1 Tax=Pacificispira spongiicola TaxID=2729598 RepID=A0A7Y0E1T9_9PROT|nr:NAD(P)-dependent oxidoreductase [Pacificispira spongiicola]NMM45626.1 NAD(P)-dependent oxidoreductase [Pacificispira spongiicola]
MRIGFIGLGTMGGPASLNLIKGGHELTVCDLDRGRAEKHLALGAKWASTPAEAVQGADVIYTMVFGPKQIDAVLRGENGVLSAIGPGQVWIDMTTNEPALTRALAADVRAKGAEAIDAPVTGAVDGARNGNMTQFAGGDEATVERLRPMMELMGAVHYMGPTGTGVITKLASNQLWAIHATAMGEALVMAVKSGVELPRAWEALKIGAAESWCMHHDAPSVFQGHYDPSFTLDLCMKDLGLIVGACDAAGTESSVTRLVRDRFQKAHETYGGDKGELHVVRLEEDAAGVSLRMDGDWVPHWEK